MWKVLYDQGKLLCFVGRSGLTKQCIDLLSQERICDNVSFEDLILQSDDWFAARRFICVSGDLVFKQQVVDFLQDRQVDFFSLIGHNNAVHPDLQIGRGTFINEYNDLLGEAYIGDHVIIGCFCQIGRHVDIGDFCHVSSYCYLNNCMIGTGTALGIRTSVVGAKLDDDVKQIAPFCNFMADSTVTKDITESGTYYGNKRVSGESRLERRLI